MFYNKNRRNPYITCVMIINLVSLEKFSFNKKKIYFHINSNKVSSIEGFLFKNRRWGISREFSITSNVSL